VRRRVVREIGTLVGVLVVLAGVVTFNYLTRQQSLREQMIAWRIQIEEQRKSKGLEMLPWKLLQQTKGNVRQGPKFVPELLEWDDRPIDLIGFMVPIETFREMTEFILLPMPIECYFCERPPMRDVVLVQMAEGETANLFREPILVNGLLRLNKGPGTKFFYTVKHTTFGPGEEDGVLTRAMPSAEHMTHVQANKMGEEELFEGTAPPRAVDVEPPGQAEASALTGEQFLRENAVKDGVVVLPSGLQYRMLREGAGRTPTATDKVRAHYRGTLVDGTEFDNSYTRNQPLVIGVQQGIAGWAEALQLMQEGAKWELVIPSELAYGERGMGGVIPPNATLVFEVELLEVLDAQ